MPTKMTIFFNQYNAGFSETFYHLEEDPNALMALVPNSLYQAAAKFRHTSVILKAVRFSKIGGARQSVLHRPYPKAQGTRYTVAEPGPDPVSTTAVYMLASTTGAKRRIWCRGLADIDVGRDAFGNDIESTTLFGLRNLYFQELFDKLFQIQYLKRPPTDGLIWEKIQSVGENVTSNPNRAYIRRAAPLPAWNRGDIISFNGISSDLPRFPRQTEIISRITVGAIDYYEIAYQLPGGIAVFPRNLRGTAKTTGFSRISLWNFERFGEHKTGRPFGSLRGRSRGVSLTR